MLLWIVITKLSIFWTTLHARLKTPLLPSSATKHRTFHLHWVSLILTSVCSSAARLYRVIACTPLFVACLEFSIILYYVTGLSSFHLWFMNICMCGTCSRPVGTMDDPPPPYSSIDESKGASYPPRNFYPAGPNVSQNQYGATSYPASSPYQEAPRSGRGAGSSFYPATSEHQPQIIIAPAGFWRFGGVQSIRQKYSTYGRHIMLSCFVICCCFPSGLLCGLLAFCIASMFPFVVIDAEVAWVVYLPSVIVFVPVSKTAILSKGGATSTLLGGSDLCRDRDTVGVEGKGSRNVEKSVVFPSRLRSLGSVVKTPRAKAPTENGFWCIL